MSSALLESYETARKAVPRGAIRPLLVIPGIGPSLGADLYLLGIRSVQSLRNRNPEALYRKLCRVVGRKVDRCVLYTFRCAVYFASEENPDPERLKWWLWMDEPSRIERSS
jgi:Pathogenicity locus